MGLMASLPDGPIAIDTAIIIYFIVAAALSMRCGACLTDDRRIPELPGMRVLQLHDPA